MNTMTYDEIQPKRLGRAELLQLFADLYDETMPLAYVEAIEAVFAHIRACEDMSDGLVAVYSRLDNSVQRVY